LGDQAALGTRGCGQHRKKFLPTSDPLRLALLIIRLIGFHLRVVTHFDFMLVPSFNGRGATKSPRLRDNKMPCEKYEKLKQEFESARQEWTYLISREGKIRLGTSDRQAKKLATEAKQRMHEQYEEFLSHPKFCLECKNSTSPVGN
jgi:hypothetical protein